MSNSVWCNIRGFNLCHKQKEVWEIVRRHEGEFVGIADIRLQENRMNVVMNSYLSGWQVEHKYHYSEQGKIWACWNRCIRQALCIDKDEQYVTMEFFKPLRDTYYVTVVYASTDIVQRRGAMNKLVYLSLIFTHRRCCWVTSTLS